MSQAGIVDIEGTHPQIPTAFVTNSGTAIPIANTLEILGTSVAAHSIPLETTASGNTVTIEAQYASASASSSAANAGLASFNSAYFTVDGNGFVSFSGTSLTETLTGNSGGPVGPTAGNISTVGVGSITVVGNPGTSTLTTQLTGLSAHNILVGQGTTTIGLIAPSTAGFVLTSNGAGSDPTFQASPPTGIVTIDGDTGSITGTTVTIYANHAALNCGSTVEFVNSGTISTLNVSDVNSNVIIGPQAGLTGSGATYSTGLGYMALAAINQSAGAVAIGVNAFQIATTALLSTAVGANAGLLILSGQYNTLYGYSAGYLYTSNESSNIMIAHYGVTGESNTLRIGMQGSGNFEVDSTYIAGITGAIPVSANTPQTVVCDNAGNLTVIDSSTAGYVLTSNGTATPSFQPSSVAFPAYTNVTNGMSPYTVLSTDDYLSVDTSGGPVTLLFPNAPTARQTWIVKDRTGTSVTNNITITTPGGTVTFDGNTSYVISTAYEAINLLANSTPTYEVF